MHVYVLSRLNESCCENHIQTFDSKSSDRGLEVLELTVSILSFWPISLWAENAIIFPSRHYYNLLYFVIKLFKKFSSGKKQLSVMLPMRAWSEPIVIKTRSIAGSKEKTTSTSNEKIY